MNHKKIQHLWRQEGLRDPRRRKRVGSSTAAVIYTTWSHPGRLRNKAAFAALTGLNPIPTSSGNTTRHRLNHGGDQRINRALHKATVTRMAHDPETHAYVQRPTAERLNTNRDPTLHQALPGPPPPPSPRSQSSHNRPFLTDIEESTANTPHPATHPQPSTLSNAPTTPKPTTHTPPRPNEKGDSHLLRRSARRPHQSGNPDACCPVHVASWFRDPLDRLAADHFGDPDGDIRRHAAAWSVLVLEDSQFLT